MTSQPYTRRVLVMDDDTDMRAMMRFVLTRYGYAVDVATNGDNTLEQLRASPDRLVVLLDLVMPGVVDGVQVLEAVTADARLASHHAYVAVSALDRPTPAVAALLSQLQASFLAKPFDLEELLAAVTEAANHLC